MPETSPKKAGAPSGHPSGDPRYKGIDRVLKRQGYQQDALIEVLTSAQEAFGYLTEDVLIYTARQLKLPFSWVYGVATFYHFFSLKPQGEHTCIVCMGTACYVGKSNEIVEALEKEFNVKAGHTTEDGKLTVTTTRCLGCCGLAPVAVLDNQILGKEIPETTIAKVKAVLAGGPVQPSAVKPEAEEETASA
jgi:bidirectional [NiFe] hydrogenase diaphorase subunit